MALKTPRKTPAVPRACSRIYFRIFKKLYDIPVPHGRFYRNGGVYRFREGKQKKRVIHYD